MNYNESNHILGYIFLIITLFSIKILDSKDTGVKLPLFVFFLSLIVPLTSIATYESMSIYYLGMIFLCYNCIILGLVYTKNLKLIWPSNNIYSIGIILMIIIYLYTYISLLIFGGLARINFNLSEVYETREMLNENRFFLSGYFISWVGYSFNPFLLVYSMYKKKKPLFWLTIFLQLLLFGMTNFKSFLFSIPLLICCYYFTKFKYQYIIITFSVSLLLILSYFHFKITKDFMLSSILIRRQFFVGAHLHFLYHEYFSNNPLVYLSDSIFKNFIDYPYHEPVTRVVSYEYFGRKFGVNVGFFGNAFYEFGYLGIATFSFILFLVLKFVNSLGEKIPANLISSIIIIPFMSLINSGLLTTLLTHSLLITIICLWLMGREKIQTIQKETQ